MSNTKARRGPEKLWTSEIERLVRERPRTRNELIAGAGPLIPAGRAARHHRRALARGTRYTGSGPPDYNGSAGLSIERGRRLLVTNILYEAVVRGALRVDKHPEDSGLDTFYIARETTE